MLYRFFLPKNGGLGHVSWNGGIVGMGPGLGDGGPGAGVGGAVLPHVTVHASWVESLSDAVEWCKDANHCCIDNSENPYMNDDRVWTTTSDTAPIEMQKDNSYGAITIYK